MTSVSVISSVIARIQHLLKPVDVPKSRDKPNQGNDVGKLLAGLQGIKKSLEDADRGEKQSEQFLDWEKRLVQLCYDIDDSLAELEVSSITAKPGRGFAAASNFLGNVISGRSSMPDLGRLVSRLSEISECPKEKTSNDMMTRESGLFGCRTREDRAVMDEKEIAALSVKEIHEQANNSEEDKASRENLITEKNMAVMEDKISGCLLQKEWPVVCIWGKRGTGKTTFAKKVFYNKQLRERFRRFAWVSMKQDFQDPQDIFQDILKQLSRTKKKDNMLTGQTRKRNNIYTRSRCLIVIEDLCIVDDDWQILRRSLSNISLGKILITSPLEEVAEAVTSSDGVVYEMNPLTAAECFKMLKEKAEIGDEEWENVGKTIFSLTGGSWLLAIILENSLTRMDAEARKKLLNDSGKIQGDQRTLLKLIYEVLSHELKPILLYMAQFPLGREIEVEKLYCLLSAENLIIPPEVLNPASASRKTIHMDILEKLALKSLVQVLDVSATRMSKCCRLYDQIRDFCIFQGLEEEFFEILDFKSIARKFRGTTRRLAVYLSKNKIEFSIDKDMAEKIRSLLIFSVCASDNAKSEWPPELDHELKEFIDLRVLDFNGIDFGISSFPKGIDKLVLLKYLSFRGCYLEDLPSYISKLLVLETLDLRTDCKMTIPDVLHIMKRLRHLYFPEEYESKDDNSKLQLNGLENLEILVNLDTSVCSVEVLSELKNIVILTTLSHENYKDLKDVIECLNQNRANLQQSSVTIENFDTHTKERATIFKNLLECESLHSLNIEGYIGQLPEDVNMSSSLTDIVFHESELEDADTINKLGKLQNLQSLVLSNDAYVGKEIKFSEASGFSNLKILKLLNLSSMTRKLTIEDGVMPNLSTLVIEDFHGRREDMVMPEALRTIINQDD